MGKYNKVYLKIVRLSLYCEIWLENDRGIDVGGWWGVGGALKHGEIPVVKC